MLPDPLHPAVVHFPLVLAFLLPISALAAWWAIRRGSRPVLAWAVPVALSVAMVGSAWLALETGENEEETVETVVPEAAIHDHEEAAERFLVAGVTVTLLLGAGLLGGGLGTAGRALGTAGSFLVLAAAIQTGYEGGELVYRHGAAAAYVAESGTAVSPAAPRRGEEGERERGEGG